MNQTTLKIILAAVVILIAIVSLVIIIRTKGLKQWLLSAVTEAEKALGSGTGKLKLQWVYNKAVSVFPIFATILPFTLFCKLVDKALEQMRDMLSTNEKINEYVTGTESEVK